MPYAPKVEATGNNKYKINLYHRIIMMIIMITITTTNLHLYDHSNTESKMKPPTKTGL
jgi:Ni,Fe-hydrogenase I cytochrome b subunit